MIATVMMITTVSLTETRFEVQDSTCSSGNFGSIEEDFDLLNSEEVVEDDQWHEARTGNRQLFISEQRLISPGSTEISRANINKT